MWRGRKVARARRHCQQIIEWNVASPELVASCEALIHEADSLNVGQRAPSFCVKDLRGDTVGLAYYRGKVLVLHFWAPSCGPCGAIYPHLRKIAHDYPRDAVSLVGVSQDTDVEAVRSRAMEEGLTWPQICEGSGGKDRLSGLYNVMGIPAIYVLDGSGQIAAKLVGEKSGAELERAVRALVDH